MHEIAYAHKIITEAKKHGDVNYLELEIGELAHVPGNELYECLKGLVDWNIVWREIPAKVKCSCGFEGHPTVLERGHDSFLIECPKCKSVPKLVEGTDIKIIKIMVN